MAKYPEAMLTPKRKMMAAGMIFIIRYLVSNSLLYLALPLRSS